MKRRTFPAVLCAAAIPATPCRAADAAEKAVAMHETARTCEHHR